MPCSQCNKNLAMDNSDKCPSCQPYKTLEEQLDMTSLKREEADCLENDPLILEKGEYLSDTP